MSNEFIKVSDEEKMRGIVMSPSAMRQVLGRFREERRRARWSLSRK